MLTEPCWVVLSGGCRLEGHYDSEAADRLAELVDRGMALRLDEECGPGCTRTVGGAAAELVLLRDRILLYVSQLERVSAPVVRGQHGDGQAAARAETARILRGLLNGSPPPREAGMHAWELSASARVVDGQEQREESAAAARGVQEVRLPE
ncbi:MULTISPECIES: hypothetical protein [Actinocorallia]|uniref:Uncharacterized protein n=2 Tax=Actinocorallia TaxID=58108 RepID=A0ABN3UH97_9ACTN